MPQKKVHNHGINFPRKNIWEKTKPIKKHHTKKTTHNFPNKKTNSNASCQKCQIGKNCQNQFVCWCVFFFPTCQVRMSRFWERCDFSPFPSFCTPPPPPCLLLFQFVLTLGTNGLLYRKPGCSGARLDPNHIANSRCNGARLGPNTIANSGCNEARWTRTLVEHCEKIRSPKSRWLRILSCAIYVKCKMRRIDGPTPIQNRSVAPCMSLKMTYFLQSSALVSPNNFFSTSKSFFET
jgi:hypothetical protein